MSNTSGQAYALRILCPVHPGQADALEILLDALETGEASPFATGTTHFARLVVIRGMDNSARGLPSEADISCPYLLISCTIDGHQPRAYLNSVLERAGPLFEAIGGHCIGFPAGPGAANREAVIDYLLHNQVAVDLFYAAYPEASVARVRTALDLRQRFIDFAVASQDKDAVRLMADFRAQFPHVPHVPPVPS